MSYPYDKNSVGHTGDIDCTRCNGIFCIPFTKSLAPSIATSETTTTLARLVNVIKLNMNKPSEIFEGENSSLRKTFDAVTSGEKPRHDINNKNCAQDIFYGPCDCWTAPSTASGEKCDGYCLEKDGYYCKGIHRSPQAVEHPNGCRKGCHEIGCEACDCPKEAEYCQCEVIVNIGFDECPECELPSAPKNTSTMAFSVNPKWREEVRCDGFYTVDEPSPKTGEQETHARQTHEWYLEASASLKPESVNPKAQVAYDDMTEEQKELDRYLARKFSLALAEQRREHQILVDTILDVKKKEIAEAHALGMREVIESFAVTSSIQNAKDIAEDLTLETTTNHPTNEQLLLGMAIYAKEIVTRLEALRRLNAK